MTERLRIAIAQSPVTTEPRENGTVVRHMMREAAAAGARLIQFPEGAMSGYPSGEAKRILAGWPVDWDALRQELEETAALARQLQLWAVIGSNHPLTPPNRPHNSLYVISDRGELVGRYDKRLISFSEVSDWYAPGAEHLFFEVDGFRFGLALCIEIQFAELFVEYAALGCDAVLLSSYSKDAMFAVQAQGHAACNALWIGFSVPAQCSEAAPSGLVGPHGHWLAQAVADGAEALVIADLDRSDEALSVALNHARGWRARARSGELHDRARVVDPRSRDRTRF